MFKCRLQIVFPGILTKHKAEENQSSGVLTGVAFIDYNNYLS